MLKKSENYYNSKSGRDGDENIGNALKSTARISGLLWKIILKRCVVHKRQQNGVAPQE